MAVCQLCDKPFTDADPKVRLCSNPKLHEGKLKIAELLRKLAVCPIAENKDVIAKIKSLEYEYEVPEIERYDFTLEAAKIKFELSEADTQ